MKKSKLGKEFGLDFLPHLLPDAVPTIFPQMEQQQLSEGEVVIRRKKREVGEALLD